MAEKNNQLEKIRHSTAHLMARAIKELFGPKVKFAIGPTIEDGFYYDFDLGRQTFAPEDLEKIEKKMTELLKQDIKFEKTELTIAQALKKTTGQPYKQELIKELKKQGEKKVTFYKLGDFEDLCQGPHVSSLKELGHFKLLSIAGAYWRGDENNKMLQRIYGTAFETAKELKKYLELRKEAQKRDHRKIGTELELFILDEEVGSGLPLYLPKGARLRWEIINFALNTYLKKGYQLVSTPHIASEKLWRHSGHSDFFKENIYPYFSIEGEKYRLKPMNCPFHVQLYKSKKRSYRELPLRWTEMGTVYRYERSGTLHGLTRCRGFTQDDAHIICTPDQLEQEVVKALELTLYMLKTFGFKDFQVDLSVRDPKSKEKFIGADRDWEKAEETLKKAITKAGFKDFQYDIGGAVFYGPKIDFKIKDAIGRKWQLSTIQFDFNLPARFKMSYINTEGKEEQPFMIHRALLGALERFLGVYIEHTAGAFPAWLAPVQAKIIPISEKFLDYAETVRNKLEEREFRIELDETDETLSKKIRNGEKEKIPYLLIVGEKEKDRQSVAVRKRGQGDLGPEKLSQFSARLEKEIAEKK